jgi:hypothetical protein
VNYRSSGQRLLDIVQVGIAMTRPVNHKWSTTIEHEHDRLVGEAF